MWIPWLRLSVSGEGMSPQLGKPVTTAHPRNGRRRSQMPDTAQVTTNGDGSEAPAGLEGVVVAHTQIGDVGALEGFYHYRQYDAIELNRRRSLEEVCYLMFSGPLPTKAAREEFGIF